MSIRSLLLANVVVVAAAAPLSAAEADPPRFDPALAADGARVFRDNCALCHGAAGKGDGPMAEKLQFAPPDLTTIYRRTRGRFSNEDIQRIIDGRKPLKGHGGPEMPVWGDALRNRDEGYSEKRAHAKIQSVVHYLASIQAR